MPLGINASEMTSKKKKRTQNQTTIIPTQQTRPPRPLKEVSSDVDDESSQHCSTDHKDTKHYLLASIDVEQEFTEDLLRADEEELAKHKEDKYAMQFNEANLKPRSVPKSERISNVHSMIDSEGKEDAVSPPLRDHSPSLSSLQSNSSIKSVSSSSRVGPPSLPMISLPRHTPPQYSRGQIAKPHPVPSANVVTTMVELVHEVIPLSQSNINTTSQQEKVEWVELQTITQGEDRSKRTDVVVIGLARGFQIWMITECGDCEEVVSERQGPLRVGKLLPSDPECQSEDKDRFADVRPIFALVDSASPLPDKQYCTLVFLSLTNGKIVHKLSFEDPIMSLHVSTRYVVVSTSTRVAICDAYTLQERRSVVLSAQFEGVSPPLSLSNSLLAFSETQIRTDILSCGGYASSFDSNNETYTGQMINVAKAISRTVTSGTAHKPETMKGIVTILNLDKWNKQEEEWTICHFAAHSASISHICFAESGRLLLTADVSGCRFHVFAILPHSMASTLAAVQHLYTLSRGNTPAKILSSSFSPDSRWITVATNHGTVHLFAICPYGGRPSGRTHSGRLMNKDSKFSRSAGLTEHEGLLDNENSKERQRMASGLNMANREHPSLKAPSLARAAGNPRVLQNAPATILTAIKKIRATKFSAENLSAWASDIAPIGMSGSSKKGRLELPKMGLTFSSRPVNDSKGTCVLVMRPDGVLCEYALRVPVSQNNDELVKVEIVPEATWMLPRTKNTVDVSAPLQPGSPLMWWMKGERVFSTMRSRHRTDSARIDPASEWISQVEDVCTYSAPHRRLWQGPQFTFYSCNEHPDATQISGAVGLTKSIPIVVGEGVATRVEWQNSASSEITAGSERDDIARQIAAAMDDLHIAPDNKKESGSADDLFYEAADRTDDLVNFDDL